ncbi:MAG: hypothetical protein RTS72_03600 [Candidatus Thorarchaeota archaeon]
MSDDTTQGYSELVSDNEDDEMESQDFELSEVSERSTRVKQAALAAIMAALSLASAPIASVIPRIPGWDIALFDPISFFWIIAFLIGGYFVGTVTVFAGTVGLFFFDPSGVGPLFKILATLPMIVIPWLMVRYTTEDKQGKKLAIPGFYIIAMFAGTLLRLLIMVPTNLVMVPLLYGPIWPVDFIITYTLVLNLSQSLWDALIPYLIVHKTQIFEKFGMW